MAKRRRKKLSLKRFWAAIKLPFVEVGAEWAGKPKAKPKRKSRSKTRALAARLPPQFSEAQIREMILAEQRAAETPLQQMLREVEEEAGQRFRKALKRGDIEEMGFYGAVRAVSNDMRKPKPPPSNW
jgi:hypothetical protein